MFGHKWEPAEGVIAESRTEQVVTGEQHHHHGHVPQVTHVYVIDVRTAAGSAFRASVPAPAGVRAQLAPGTRVHLEVNPKTNEVRFDPSHPVDRGSQVESLREAVHLARDLRREMTAQQHGAQHHGAQQHGAGAGAGAGAAGMIQAAAAEAIAARLAGAGGHGPAMTGGPEAAELAQALMSGGPGREAAIARLKALAQERAQHGAPGGPQVFISSETTVVSGGHVISGGDQPRVIRAPEPEGFSSPGPAGFDDVAAPAPPQVQPPQVQQPFIPPVITPPASQPSTFGEEMGEF